jgi:signal transduction histidine kinase
MLPGESSAMRTEEAPRLLREACHDLRQPVAGVLRLAAVALAQPGVPDATRSCLEQIVTQTGSLAELIHQWLYADELDKATVLVTDLRRLAAEAAAVERVTYRGQVKLVSPAGPILIRVTRVDARRVISNLLSNATRAAGPEGTVTIEVASDRDLAAVTVEDTGPGFGKIPQGKGLGLSIIAQALVRCGGRLEYGPGSLGGVRASLWLPLAAA